MWHVWGKRKMHIEFWRGNLGERHNLEDLGVDVRIMLRWIFRKWDVGVCSGSS
jgi:hypothetical protein